MTTIVVSMKFILLNLSFYCSAPFMYKYCNFTNASIVCILCNLFCHCRLFDLVCSMSCLESDNWHVVTIIQLM